MKDALTLLREMERKYVRVIEQMKEDNLVVHPSVQALGKVQEDLERARQSIRELEAQAKSPRRQKATKRKK